MATVDWQRVQGAGLLDEVFASSAPVLDIGDRYEIGEPIGSGGQGKVYRARDCLLGREVAVKMVHQRSANRHLQAEAALLARLSHPAIPSVYDRGMGVDGRAYMVMELIAGQPLRQAIADEDWPLRERLRVFRAVAAAVAHAHERGILHRDCKPGNIALRDDGEAFLLDWGLAATGDPRAICGTPCYAAPEQLNGQVADRRSDVYSLGVLLYQVMSGHLPFARVVNDFAEFRAQRAGLGLVPLRRYRPDLRPSYQRVIDRAMAAQPAARYERCKHLIADIDALIAGERVSVDPYHWRRPKGLVPAAAAAALAFALGWWWPRTPPVAPDWPGSAASPVQPGARPFADLPPPSPPAPWAAAEQAAAPRVDPIDESADAEPPPAVPAVDQAEAETADGVALGIQSEEAAPQPEPPLPPLLIAAPRPAGAQEGADRSQSPERDWDLLQLPTLQDLAEE